MSIFKQNVYIANGVSMPNTKSTKVKAKVLTKLSAGQTLTMYSNLAIASILLTSAENSFRHFKKVADFDPDCEAVVKMYESFMMNVGEAGLSMENALKNDTTSAKVFNIMERPLKAYIKKGLNISNFTNYNEFAPCVVTEEGHYRAESNDRTATGDPQTILDLVVIKQGNEFRCINTDGSFKSYRYNDIKNEFQFFKTNS